MDQEFEKLLQEMQKKQASDFQVEKWKKAVRNKNRQIYLKNTSRKGFYWAQMTAAVLVGVVIGGLIFGDLNQQKNSEPQEISYEDATIEMIYTKL